MKERLETLNRALHHVCELMECYSALKGETDFATLISDYKYAALVGLQVEIFTHVRKLEKRDDGTSGTALH